MDLKAAMETTFSKIEHFCQQNRLKLNSGKSHFLVIASSQKKIHHETHFSLRLGTSEVISSSEERVLGIQVGNTLSNWKFQIDNSKRSVIQKCAMKMAGLRLVGKYL